MKIYIHMSCPICFETIHKYGKASFADGIGCRNDHLVCLSCYHQITSCPLCRYVPSIKPQPNAELMLDELRNRRYNHVSEINCIENEMLNIKNYINNSYRHR